MPVEHDDESTRFDSRPWGGQQRLIPLGHRFARPAPSPADASPERPAIAPPRRTAKGTRQPRLSAPVERGTVPSMTNPASIGAPISTSSMPEVVGSLAPLTPAPMPTVSMRAPIPAASMPAPIAAPFVAPMHAPIAAAPMHAPIVAAPMHAPIVAAPMHAPIAATPMSAARNRPSSIPAFSVKHGCAIGGFIVPHLPRVAEVFTSEDRTIAVRRRPLTKRSMIAIPLGALAALVAIIVVYFTQPSPTTKPTSLGASAIQTESHTMNVTLELAPQAEPHVMKVIAEPTETEPHVMKATYEAPATAPAPTATQPAAEPAAEPVIVDVPAVTDATTTISKVSKADLSEVETEDRPSRRRARVSKRQHKPRRIVAVDSSTPLGNLRPDRM